MIRAASPEDIPSLMQIEERSFTGDRLSHRSFRHLLTRANALTLVEVDRRGTVRGYAMILLRRGSQLGRLYSIAVAPERRARGVGRALLAAAEDAARGRGLIGLRLEVRTRNSSAQKLYCRAGYMPRGLTRRYYADGAAALRMEKAFPASGHRTRTAPSPALRGRRERSGS